MFKQIILVKKLQKNYKIYLICRKEGVSNNNVLFILTYLPQNRK